ncbi:hypothetical protein V9T40_008883 [Parthenolecanium corni]|uniref:Uncharacterized protein n=1 Tax=Parthenolecanium corni TaxID=536013 RepID=A0AAN9Y8A2_9HEMI
MTSTRHDIFLKLHFPDIHFHDNRFPDILFLDIHFSDIIFLTFIFPTAQQPTHFSVIMAKLGECRARAITAATATEDAATATEEGIVVLRGPVESSHTHPSRQEQCEVEEVLIRVKIKAEEHPEQPLAQLLHNELADVPAGKTVLGK